MGKINIDRKITLISINLKYIYIQIICMTCMRNGEDDRKRGDKKSSRNF